MSFAIKRWNGLITPANIHPQPVIYIQPDINLLSFAEQNNNTILVKIDGTGLAYDNQVILASLMPSSEGPTGCRPNFFKETGLYAVVLTSQWYGQPEDETSLGFMTVLNLKVVDGVMVDPKETSRKTPENAVMASRPNGFFGVFDNDLYILAFGVFIFIIVVVYCLWDSFSVTSFSGKEIVRSKRK